MHTSRREGYDSIPSADEVELEAIAKEHEKSHGHSKNYWEKKWDSMSGTPMRKSILLLSEYSGDGLGLFGRVISGRWGTKNGKLVEEVLKVMDNTPNIYDADISYLFFHLNSKLTAAPKDGDFKRITTVMREKTRADESKRDFGLIKKWV